MVTDIRMPPTGTDEGIQAASWLREHRPKVGVVVLSQFTAPAYALALLEDGLGRPGLPPEGAGGRGGRIGPSHPHRGPGGSVIDPLVVDELVEAALDPPDLGPVVAHAP